MPARIQAPSPAGLLSIGALSAATGVPVETIRTWERRYGFPVAERKPSGHRVYPLTTVPRLRLIAQALTRGHRAAEVVPASERTLESLLAAVPLAVARRGPARPPAVPVPLSDPSDLLDAVRGFDSDRLKRILHAEWARLGPLEFLERRAAPFLTAVGEAWAAGALDVRHEHFASACLGDFLRAVRMPLDDRASGPLAALATLPGELHGLGLQMSALVFALAGWRVLVLGVDTPAEQIEALAREAPIAAVALSCAAPSRGATAGSLRALRRRLPRHIPLLVGGAGAPPAARQGGIEILGDLAALELWLRDHAAG
ncbi:MAG TPA: cobalamin B12-binding domain-containing protein [Gemmatimonadales bacterium]|nr:cobalamin B12-binding domain-containing protein [Gemmatimonadales bacterium]